MRLVLVSLFFILGKCKMYKVENTIHSDEYWKPVQKITDKNFTEKSEKSILPKEDKPVFRHNVIKLNKKHEGTSNWPKIQQLPLAKSKPEISPKRKKSLRLPPRKLPARITKMQMMQEGKQTTPLEESSEEADDSSDEYLSSYSIRQQLEKIARKIPYSNVTVEVIGRTIEYQDIVLLKITKRNNDSDKYFRADDDKYADEKPEKKIVFIVHGLSVMGIKRLPCLSWERHFLMLASYYTNHLDSYDIFLIPMANPDGYAMLQPAYGYIWNKNTAPQKECVGVALDRNFDVAWSNNRSISSCSQEYPGIVPFSEAETRAIRDIFHKYSHKIVAFLNVHSGSYDSNTLKGDAVLYPKGYTDSVLDDDKYIDLKAEIDEAIRNASFQVFSVAMDTLYNWYGRVTGSSVDYASTVYGIPFALELVMQLYDNENVNESNETYTESALTEVWSRVIDVIFKYIWKVLNKGNEVQ